MAQKNLILQYLDNLQIYNIKNYFFFIATALIKSKEIPSSECHKNVPDPLNTGYEVKYK